VTDGPVGVLAEGAGGVLVARALFARLPKEDVLLLQDDAYAPYARRAARVVADRTPRLAAEIAAGGAKVLVVASLQAGEDALEPIAAAAGVPTLGLDATLVHAAARARGGPIAAVFAEGTLRGRPWLRANRFQRGGAEVVPIAWRPGSPAPSVPADSTVALICPLAAALALQYDDPVDCAEVVAERVHRQLVRMGALARRHRAGRLLTMSSHPLRA
jgi:hypothetical protein